MLFYTCHYLLTDIKKIVRKTRPSTDKSVLMLVPIMIIRKNNTWIFDNYKEFEQSWYIWYTIFSMFFKKLCDFINTRAFFCRFLNFKNNPQFLLYFLKIVQNLSTVPYKTILCVLWPSHLLFSKYCGKSSGCTII